jgi:hypothetical protein
MQVMYKETNDDEMISVRKSHFPSYLKDFIYKFINNGEKCSDSKILDVN